MLRDALVVAAVAVVAVQALRRFGGDRYVVPSDSMQPVLNGDSLHGDVVFVD
jgi:signal peptidase I